MKIHFFCRLYNTGWRKTDLDNEELALVGLGVKRAMYTPVNIKWGPGVQHFAMGSPPNGVRGRAHFCGLGITIICEKSEKNQKCESKMRFSGI